MSTYERQSEEVTAWIKNPDLDDFDNWEEWSEGFTSWEELLNEHTFFNETEKKLTMSKDTSDDPQYYAFYKPKEGIPYWVQVPVKVSPVLTPPLSIVQKKGKEKKVVLS